MKKLITMALAILITAFIAVFASDKTPSPMPQKHYDYQMSFNKIIVSDDISVHLKESDSKSIDVSGSDADVENVDWKIKDGVLYLQSKKGLLKDKVLVTVDVNKLAKIIIRGQSTVTSAGALLSPSLYVYMEAESYVAIKSTGKIYIINNNHVDLHVKNAIGDVSISK